MEIWIVGKDLMKQSYHQKIRDRDKHIETDQLDPAYFLTTS